MGVVDTHGHLKSPTKGFLVSSRIQGDIQILNHILEVEMKDKKVVFLSLVFRSHWILEREINQTSLLLRLAFHIHLQP